MDIISSRLQCHHLLGDPINPIEKVVAHFGAVQAQDFTAAEWALSLRMNRCIKSDIDAAFNDGRILRTHVLRPTWHFVLPEDIRWMTRLTAPRIKQAMSYYNRKLELDDRFFAKSHRIITDALSKENYLTRPELAIRLSQRGISASGQRLGHIVMQAEIDGLICSGPLRGKQFTYALISDRAPNAKNLSRDESLALLVRRYFTSHGPAMLQDFTWWSGLTARDTELALKLVKNEFAVEKIGEKEYLFMGSLKKDNPKSHILLLSVYDEYVIAYKDYSPVFIDKTKSLSNIFGNAQLAYVVVKDGRIIGTWHRKIDSKKIVIYLHLEINFDAKNKKLLQNEAKRYGDFNNLPVEIIFS